MKSILLVVASFLLYSQGIVAQTADYQINVGGLYFNDKANYGFMTGCYLVGWMKPINNWQIGSFVDFTGGGLNLKNGLYQESATNWQAGAQLRYHFNSNNAYASIAIGYGQNYLDGKLATGLTNSLFSHYLTAKLEFSSSGGRWAWLARQTESSPWLNEANLFLAVRWPLKEDKFFWPDKPDNLYALAQSLSFGSEVSVIDAKISKKILLPFGLSGSFNQYNRDNPKFFYQLGLYGDLFYQRGKIFRWTAEYQAGINGIKFARWVFGITLDVGFFTKKNLDNQNQNINNKKNTKNNRRKK